MRCYLIRDNRVTVCPAAPKTIGDGSILVRTTKDLDALRFPISRLITLWNHLPGTAPVKRFTDRPTAVKRVWQTLEALPLSSARADSKQAQLIALLQRPEGARMADLMSATGWQAHSVRGVLSGVLRKKLGLAVSSKREGDVRVYRIAP
jgi:hypothetical protein